MSIVVDYTGMVTPLIVNVFIMCDFVVNKEVEVILTIIVLPVNVVLGPVLNAIFLPHRHRSLPVVNLM